MRNNNTAIIISIVAMIVCGLAAYLGQGSAALFDTCVLLLTCAFGTLFYSLLHRAYQW